MKTHSVAASHFMPYIAIIITCRGRRRNPFSNNNWIWCSSSASLVQRERDGIARSRRRNDCCRLRRPFTKLDLYLLVFYCSNCVCVVIIDLISFSALWYIIMDPLEQFGIHYILRNDFLPSELVRLDNGMNEFRCWRCASAFSYPISPSLNIVGYIMGNPYCFPSILDDYTNQPTVS